MIKRKSVKKAVFFVMAVFLTAQLFAKSRKNRNEIPASDQAVVQSEEESDREAELKETDIFPEEQKPEELFSEKSFTVKKGNIQISVKGGTGSFRLSVLDDNGKAVDITESYDEFVSSFFSVLIGTKEYRLRNKTGITTGARKTDGGVQLLYEVQNIARVLVDFTCLKSDAEQPDDIIRVDISVENTGKKPEYFALKSVLDTVLGEKNSRHFLSSSGRLPEGECQFKSFEDVKYIVSKNEKTGMQIIFTGVDCTRPDLVSLGNKDVFTQENWIPEISSGKPFDSVFSYNNSAAGIIWPAVKLGPNQTNHEVYYIATAASFREFGTEKFLKNMEGNTYDLKRTSESGAVSISAEKLDSAYIQKLIDRINRLDPNQNIDKGELQYLNKELDAIMDALRK